MMVSGPMVLYWISLNAGVFDLCDERLVVVGVSGAVGAVVAVDILAWK